MPFIDLNIENYNWNIQNGVSDLEDLRYMLSVSYLLQREKWVYRFLRGKGSIKVIEVGGFKGFWDLFHNPEFKPKLMRNFGLSMEKLFNGEWILYFEVNKIEEWIESKVFRYIDSSRMRFQLPAEKRCFLQCNYCKNHDPEMYKLCSEKIKPYVEQFTMENLCQKIYDNTIVNFFLKNRN